MKLILYLLKQLKTVELIKLHYQNNERFKIKVKIETVSQIYEEIIQKSAKISDESFIISKSFMQLIQEIDINISETDTRLSQLGFSIGLTTSIIDRDIIQSNMDKLSIVSNEKLVKNIDKLEHLSERYRKEVKNKLTLEYEKMK